MRVMIVDDELIAIKMMEKLIGNYEQLKIIKSISDPEIVLNEIETLKPDLLFLDINMGSLSGIELGNYLSEMFPEMKIVFVTAYSEYAVEAFELNAIDYLLKPVSKKRFDKMMEKLSMSNMVSLENQKSFYFVVFDEGSIYNSNGQEVLLRTKKAYEILFLLNHMKDKRVTKDKLIELLWPDQSKESTTMMLHTTIYQIRKHFKEFYNQNPIKYQKGAYYLNINIKDDIKYIEKILANKVSQLNSHHLVKIYKGKYFYYNDYSWASEYREALHLRVIHYLIEAIQYDLIALPDLKIVMLRFWEDLVLEEKHIDYIYHYYKRHGLIVEAVKFIRETRSFWEEELDIPLPQTLSALLVR
ncbi:response regulator [Vagococcus lutrae]|uniref:response regulator n=1 Tax=Vagococcus lutrae TaxID=81947 RepID=UPI000F86B0C3|nr:response regulator [Vagococcus lutrae]RST92660.1 hypothetical protein CBF33_04455 [Vagococcus lutrae]